MLDKKGKPVDPKRITKAELFEYIELLEQEIEDQKKARQEDQVLFDHVEEDYKQTIKDLNQEILRLRGKTMSQEITLTSYKDRVGIPILIEGKEHDFYRGEQKDYLLNLIKKAINGMDKYTRGYDILQSILDANPEVGIRHRMQEDIATSLKNYTRFDPSVKQALADAGLIIKDLNMSHANLCFHGDDRYRVTIAKTPSDNRTGLNCYSDINKICF